MSKADGKGSIPAGVYTGRVGTDAFPGVSGNVYKSLLMVCDPQRDEIVGCMGVDKDGVRCN